MEGEKEERKDVLGFWGGRKGGYGKRSEITLRGDTQEQHFPQCE